jgi:hypothetical protein
LTTLAIWEGIPMGYKARCKYCGKSIDIREAYKIVHGKSNHYYCNIEEYAMVQKAQKIKDDTYKLIYEIFGRTIINTVLYKEINGISSVYEYGKINGYLLENKTYLSNVMQNKQFQNEYAQIRYFAAILKNNLENFHFIKKEPTNKEVEIDMPSCNFNRRPSRKTLAEYEKEVGEEA